jgi:hypothetical protein
LFSRTWNPTISTFFLKLRFHVSILQSENIFFSINGLLLDVENFICVVYAFPSMRDHFFSGANKKTSSFISYHLQRRFAKALAKRKCPGRSLETHLLVDIRSTIS